MSKYTSCELIMNFGVTKIFIVNLCMNSFVFNELRSVVFQGEYASSLGLFRTREHASESLDHFEAYLFWYAFKWNH
jgi:hypothetical protein